MNIKIPYDYINVLLFQTLLKYENRRSVSKEKLEKYQEMLLEEVLKEDKYEKETGNITHFLDVDRWEGDISFFSAEGDGFDNFIEKYSQYFEFDGDTISLCDGVSFDDICQLKKKIEEEENISGRFEDVCDCDSLQELLGINTIRNLLTKYIEVEKKLEKAYSKLDKCHDTTVVMGELKKLLLMRVMFLNSVSKNNREVIDAFRIDATKLHNVPELFYDKYPIDLEQWKNSKYYCDKIEEVDDIFNDIDDRLYYIYQYAIFGKKSLAYDKVHEMLENMYLFGKDNNICLDFSDECFDTSLFDDNASFDEIFDNEDTYSLVDTEESDLLFYLTYLQKLGAYMNEYGETPDLIETRSRLLYALDMPNFGLFRDENISLELEKIDDEDIDEEYFEFFEDEIKFMADEVFNVATDINSVKKLLLISTYYEFTQNEEIVSIMNEHSSDSRFEQFSEIVFGEDKGKIKKIGFKL